MRHHIAQILGVGGVQAVVWTGIRGFWAMDLAKQHVPTPLKDL